MAGSVSFDGAAGDVLGCCSPLLLEPVSTGQAEGLARVFKALGDPARVRLLSMVASHPQGEACVCDLARVFDLSGPTISHHLKVLRESGLVTGQRRGTWVYYRVIPEVLALLAGVLGARPDRLPVAGAARAECAGVGSGSGRADASVGCPGALRDDRSPTAPA